MPKSRGQVSKHLSKISHTRIILAVTALAVVYFLAAGAFNAIRSHHLRGEEGRLRAEIQDIQRRYDRLQALKDYVNSDEYVESVARGQLGLVRQGETAFIAISSVPTPTPAAGEARPELWWDVLIR